MKLLATIFGLYRDRVKGRVRVWAAQAAERLLAHLGITSEGIPIECPRCNRPVGEAFVRWPWRGKPRLWDFECLNGYLGGTLVPREPVDISPFHRVDHIDPSGRRAHLN